MSEMDPCPQCGGKLKATLAPLWGWRCPNCHYVWLPTSEDQLSEVQLRALLELAEENIEFEGQRADRAEARVAELEAKVGELTKIDEDTARQLTEHAEAAGVDPDHIDYIEETTKAIVALWAKNSELLAAKQAADRLAQAVREIIEYEDGCSYIYGHADTKVPQALKAYESAPAPVKP